MDELSYAGEPVILGALKGRIAIIIPCYSELAMLGEHLDALALQDRMDFDAVIVASDVLDMAKAVKIASGRPFGIAIIRRGSDTGSAGGFYAGQKYAMEKGYESMVFADVDAIPLGHDAVGILLAARESGHELVLSGARLYFEGETVVESKPAVLPFYGLISAGLVRRAGFVFAPAYNGSEDNDYLQRLSGFARPFISGNWVRHPIITPFFSKSFDRDGRYITNQLVLIPGPRLLGYHFFATALLAPAFIIFGEPYARELAFFVLRNVLAGKYGRVLAAFKTRQSEAVMKAGLGEFSRILTVLPKRRDEPNAAFIGQGGGTAEKLMRPLRAAALTFRKKALLYITNQFSIPISMMFAGETWLYARDGMAYRISDNRNPAVHILRLLIFALAFPSFLLFSAFLLVLRLAAKPDTRGYGLGAEKRP